MLILVIVPSAIVGFVFGILYDYSDVFSSAGDVNTWFAQIETQILLMAFALPITVMMVSTIALKFRTVFSNCSTVSQYLAMQRITVRAMLYWTAISILFWCLLTGSHQ